MPGSAAAPGSALVPGRSIARLCSSARDCSSYEILLTCTSAATNSALGCKILVMHSGFGRGVEGGDQVQTDCYTIGSPIVNGLFNRITFARALLLLGKVSDEIVEPADLLSLSVASRFGLGPS